jgi:hypothetical protein
MNLEATTPTNTTTIEVAFDEGVQLPKTPKYLALPEQTIQWSRNSQCLPSPPPAIPAAVDDNDSDQAQAKCTIEGNAAKMSEEKCKPLAEKDYFNATPKPTQETNPAAMTVNTKKVTPSPHKSNKENVLNESTTSDQDNGNPSTLRVLQSTPDRNTMQAFNVSSRVLFAKDDRSASDNNQEATSSLQEEQAPYDDNSQGLVSSSSWGRERTVEKDISNIKSQLQLAENALQLAEEHELVTKHKLQRQVEDLKEQLQTAKDAAEAVKEKLSNTKSGEEWRLKAMFKAKEEAEKEVQDLKSQLEVTEADSMKKKEEHIAAAEKLRGMLKGVQDSCTKAREEVHRTKVEEEIKLKEALDAKSKVEEEVASLMEELRVAEETRACVEKLLKDEKRESAETMLLLKAKIDSAQKEESKRSEEREAAIKAKAQERVNILFESQKQDKELIESLKKKLEEKERKLKLAQDERKKDLQVSSITREQDTKQSQAPRKELEKAEKEVRQLREQITALQASLQVAEDGRQMSLNALKSDGQAQLKNETEARLRAEKEIVRLEAEVDKSVKGEKRAKQLLEGLKKDFEKKAAEMESKEHKNRAMAEEARQKAESIVADMSDAKQGRLKAEVEIIKIRGTWVFISLLIFLITFVGTSNEHPMQNLMQSFNKTLSNFVPDSEMKTNPMAQNKRHRQMLKKDYKQGDARMKQEAATQAKIAADWKDSEEAKQKAQTEKDSAQKAKKEAELLARQKADGEALRREVRAFQTEHNTVDEIILLW